MNLNRIAFLNNIKKVSQNLNKMTDSLPNYMFTDTFDTLMGNISLFVSNHFQKNLNIEEVKEYMVSKEIFEQVNTCDYSILNDNKNLLINSQLNNEEV